MTCTCDGGGDVLKRIGACPLPAAWVVVEPEDWPARQRHDVCWLHKYRLKTRDTLMTVTPLAAALPRSA